MKIIQIVYLIWCFTLPICSENACCTPLNQQGVCASLKHCPEVVNLFTALSVDRAKQYATVLQSICGYKTTLDNYPVVCCHKRIAAPKVENNHFDDISKTQTVILVTTTLTNSDREIRLGNICLTPLDQQGFCVSLKHCPEVVHLFTVLPINRAKQYSSVLQRICGFETTQDNYPVVCCSQIIPDTSQVGQTSQSPELVTRTTKTTPQEISTTTPLPENNDTEERSIGTKQKPETRICQGPDLVNGICTPLADCAPLFERLKNNPSDEDLKKLLRASNKLCQSQGTNVCCPRSTTNASNRDGNSLQNEIAPKRLPTADEGCGLVKLQANKVIGGEESELGAWPWIALIGYNPYSLAPFKCGGSLITARHVITAAHCIRSDLSFVRLGEYDLSTETETTHVDIDVTKMIKHPNFSKNGRNDLAILFLIKNAEFTDLISPICMPISPQLRSKSYIQSNPIVAGWGRTMEGGTNSNILQQLQIPVLENSVCRKSYEANRRLFSEEQFDSSVICAGVLTGGRDTCQGDSGGPLMMPEPYKGITRYYLIGIVSYGIGCARIGIPGVYTSTQYYMNWISEQIANE